MWVGGWMKGGRDRWRDVRLKGWRDGRTYRDWSLVQWKLKNFHVGTINWLEGRHDSIFENISQKIRIQSTVPMKEKKKR